MVGIKKRLFGRLLLLSVCSVGATILLALEFGRGLLSPRELGIALLILFVAIGGGAVLIIRKSASEYRTAPEPSKDDARNRRPISRLRAIFAFVFGGGLLIFLSPYIIHEAAIKHIPWSVPIIVIPMYAVLSYGGFKQYWPHIIGRTGTTSQKDPNKRD
jgi:hypothetical protein